MTDREQARTELAKERRMKQHPMLMRGGLTNIVYVVTRYKDLGNGRLEALEKWDVTEQFDALVTPPDSAAETTYSAEAHRHSIGDDG